MRAAVLAARRLIPSEIIVAVPVGARETCRTLAEVADTAAFLASDRASAMTGAIVNLTSGAVVD